MRSDLEAKAERTCEIQNPIRVMHLITSLDIGGAEVMLTRLLQESGTQTCVVCVKPAGILAQRLEQQGIQVISLEVTGVDSAVKGAMRLWRQIKLMQPDILQTWLYHADLFGFIVGRMAGVSQIIWTIRRSGPSNQDSRLIRYLAKVNAFLARWVDTVIVNSDRGAKDHQALGYPQSSMRVIDNGFDVDAFYSRWGSQHAQARALYSLEPDVFVIGLLARWNLVKGHELFLAAASQFIQEKPDTVFILAGDRIDRSNQVLMDLIERYGLANNVRLLGPLKDPRLFYAACDLFALTSHAEGFPNVIAEAMSSEVPCVAADVGDCQRVLGDARCLVSGRDPSTFCQAWLAIARMPREDRKRLGFELRNRVETQFSLKTVRRCYEDVYHNLTESD